MIFIVLNFKLFTKFVFFLVILIILTIIDSATSTSPSPHIVFILADDLGWNDVAYHGSNQIPTPNIDALAYTGVILNNYYVAPICTPSRSALMTGKYPIHTGMQHRVLYGAEPRGLPLNEKLLPEYLKDLGYTNHIVGKWHLGNYKLTYTPTYRGFDSHVGFWTGHHDYYDHIAMETGYWGFDMRRNTTLALDLMGQYSTDVFTREAVRIISNHDQEKPLFLYVAHAAVHSANPYNPLPAPDDEIARFSYIKDYNRQKFAAMVSRLDNSIGQVVESLRAKNMLNNCIIVFSSDNGGPAAGFNINAASNWPLKGVKNTYWDGGVRATGLIWSPLIVRQSRVSNQLMHISDWLPTLYAIAGGDTSRLPLMDGVNVWNALSSDLVSPRHEVLHNIDDIFGVSSLMMDKWKIINGTTYNGTWDNTYGPSGREYSYQPFAILASLAGTAVMSIGMDLNVPKINLLRNASTIVCSTEIKELCQPLVAPCLFNIHEDPCETNNLAKKFPEVLQRLSQRIKEFNATQVSPGNLPLDPRGNPALWNNTWTNFGDFIH